jgi:hypothetical protein
MCRLPVISRRTPAALGVAALIAVAGAWTVSPARASVVRMSLGAPHGRPLAADFLGLSLEYRSIPGFTGANPAAVNPVLVQLIRNLVPHGRPSLRIGGQSGDRTWWPVRGVSPPLGITYSLTPRWMTSARTLARATDGRLILGLGLEANRTRLDAVEGAELLAGIGRRYIAALEIGNEPELYTVVPWYRKLRGKPIPWNFHDGKPVFARRAGYGPTAFYEEFERTLRVLPRLPIAGPATGHVSWLDGLRPFLAPGSRVRMVTWHAYGLNQCVTDPSAPMYPSVPNLLAPRASRGLVTGISPDVALAHAVGASFRIDEINSISCNGRLGVSNTFASGLWILDSLFSIAAAGVDGVNVHTYQHAANGLFDFADSGGRWSATVHPLYYGMMMFARAAPPGSRLLAIHAGRQNKVRAWATLAPDHRVRVLLINDSRAAPARVLISVPRSGRANIERLLAPSAFATAGVTLGGARFASPTATGLLPPPREGAIRSVAGEYPVTLPAASAALITLASRG